jgi:hypothetical protein
MSTVETKTSPGTFGTAGASPASSSGFTQAGVESGNFNEVAFNDSGRGARGPSKSGALDDLESGETGAETIFALNEEANEHS